MANIEREFKFTDKRRTVNQSTSGLTGTYGTVNDLRTALAASNAHGASYYTSARLDRMTKNDMVYALRLISDAAGI